MMFHALENCPLAVEASRGLREADAGSADGKEAADMLISPRAEVEGDIHSDMATHSGAKRAGDVVRRS